VKRQRAEVKALHQEFESNTKSSFIMGHSFQAVVILPGALKSVFAVPLVSRIHEGEVVSNRDSPTLLDKMIALIESLGIDQPFYFIADAYYASGKIVRKLLKNEGISGNFRNFRDVLQIISFSWPQQARGLHS